MEVMKATRALAAAEVNEGIIKVGNVKLRLYINEDLLLFKIIIITNFTNILLRSHSPIIFLIIIILSYRGF